MKKRVKQTFKPRFTFWVQDPRTDLYSCNVEDLKKARLDCRNSEDTVKIKMGHSYPTFAKALAGGPLEWNDVMMVESGLDDRDFAVLKPWDVPETKK